MRYIIIFILNSLFISKSFSLQIESTNIYVNSNEEINLRILSSTDIEVFSPILKKFSESNKNISIEYIVASTADIYDEIKNNRDSRFDLVMSSAMDLQIKLANDGYAKNIELRYNSNAVEWRDDLFDLWAEFKRVRFHYSIDALGSQNDYIRYPSKWSHQEEVFWKLDNTAPQVEVTTATTIMALNVAYIPEFVQWKVEQGFKKINAWPFGAGGINMHFAYWPPQLNVKVLPLELKKQITDKYENEFYPWMEENWQKFTGVKENNITHKQFFEDNPYGLKRYKGIINFMNSEDWSTRMPEFKEWVNLVNKQRGYDNFEQIFPIFKGYL